MCKAPLLNEGIEYLSVEEELEEWQFTRVAVLEKVFLVKQMTSIAGTLRRSRQQRRQGFPRMRREERRGVEKREGKKREW